MSTNDVPGSNPRNADKLAGGCWAESEDGSLVYVYAYEGDKVVYTMFDISKDPPMEYRTALEISDFEKLFTCSRNDIGKPVSVGGKTTAKVLWTWHDKTPFPWGKIMKTFSEGAKVASFEGHISAVERIAKDLGLRMQVVNEDEIRSNAGHEAKPGVARSMGQRLRGAIDEFLRP